MGIGCVKNNIFGLNNRKIIFFGGKGGVGKTSCASAYSLIHAEEGNRVLLVSTDPAHSTSDIFNLNLSGGIIRPVCLNLDCIEIDSEREMNLYIDGVRENLYSILRPAVRREMDKQLDLAKMSPGAEESALFLKISGLISDEMDHYDQIVFDTAPTGHTLRLLSLPELMSSWIEGMISQRKKVQTLKKMWDTVTHKKQEEDKILKILYERRKLFSGFRDNIIKKDLCAFLFVLIPERLPILETYKAIQSLEKNLIPIGGIIVNKVLPEDGLGDFFIHRKGQENKYLEEIRELFFGKDLWYNYLAETDLNGVELLREFGRRFIKNIDL